MQGPSLSGMTDFLDTFASPPWFSAKTAQSSQKGEVGLDLACLPPPPPQADFLLFVVCD